MALLVCAVLVGNMFPVVERPHIYRKKTSWLSSLVHAKQEANPEVNPNGYLGKAIVGKADTHVVIVAKDPEADEGDGDPEPLPCPPDRWPHVQTYTELVLQDDSQALALGYVMVHPQGGDGR